jgi:hypothetical protein
MLDCVSNNQPSKHDDDSISPSRFLVSFELEETLPHVATAFPQVRRAMNHTVREYLSLGA